MKFSTPAQREKLYEIICDVCMTSFAPDNSFNDKMEEQEFLSFSSVAGYGSQHIGDMTSWSIDMCQHCVNKHLGPYIRKQRLTDCSI